MCGISCILALHAHRHTHTRNSISHQLSASLDQINHRGPDSRGDWISSDNRVAFGHVRLAINDLSPDGAQPFHSADNAIHAVVNGEFYDYDNIKADLLSKTDYHFRSRSDSELIIALYSYYGLDFVHHLRGEFACVLFDEKRQFFVAVRDRYGIKPLFWTVQQGRLLVAAEVKAFLPLGWDKREWDVRSLMDAGWNHDERTIFKDVNKIRPGHYLTCQSFGHVEQRQYWDISYPDKHLPDPRTPDELITAVRDHLLESIRIRLRADVPIGIYLSGGIDSSVIAGMVTHLVKEQGVAMGSADPTSRLSCFSIAFDEASGFDESAISNRTAEWLGVKYIKKHMNEEELVNRFEDATWHAEHHNPDLNYIGKYALSEVPQQEGFKVVLTGEGADEQFGGYPVFLPDYLREQDPSWQWNSLTEQERETQFDLAEKAAGDYYKSVGADAGNRGESVVRRMLNNVSTVSSMAAFQLDLFSPWTSCYGGCDPQTTIAYNVDGKTRALMVDSAKSTQSPASASEHHSLEKDAPAQWHPLNTAMYIWSKGHLANIFLTCLGDRGEMAHSIEARTPFLDHKFTEFVNHIPPSAKIRWEGENGGKRFTEKWILREASKPFITRELYERKKHPYSAPTSWPKGGSLHSFLDETITEDNVNALGFVDWQRCKCLVSRAFAQGSAEEATDGGPEGEGGELDESVKAMAMRYSIVVAQWVIIGRRFGLMKAEMPGGM